MPAHQEIGRVRLFSYQMAPNPQRSLAVALEKGIDVDLVYVSRENYREFASVSPFRKTPVLVLADDGVLTESLTICQYLDAISGPPFLFGEGLEERTRIAMWERRAEFELFSFAVTVYHNIHPIFRERISQSMEHAQTALVRCAQFLTFLGDQMPLGGYLAGAQFSAADITAYIAYTWLEGMHVLPDEMPSAVADWAHKLSGRACFRSLLAVRSSLSLGSGT